MSRDDYDDDDRPRRRRRRDDDYDDIGRVGGGSSSGSVTGVGVISIILGSMTLLCGLCVVVLSMGIFGGAGGGNFGGRANFPDIFQAAAGVMIVISILVLVLGVLYLVGGIGVLQRRNWGRIMTLIMAGFSALLGIFCILVMISMLVQPGPPEGKVIGALMVIVGVIVYFTHCIMSFVVLLSSQNAREFE